MRLDRERDGLAGGGQVLQCPRRAIDDIADAMDVENDEILADGIDCATQLADHALRTAVIL